MIKDKFISRYEELEKQFHQMPYHTSEFSNTCFVADGYWKKWATSAQNLIRATFSEKSPHYDRFAEAFDEQDSGETSIRGMGAIFLSAKEDFEGGYAFDVELRVSGEVFGDFIVLAKQSMSEGHKDVAAVLTSAALEDALKRYALSVEIDVDGKSMTQIINALKSKGHVSGAQKTLLGIMPKLRNSALHADWDHLSEPDVNSMISFVEQFLLTKFDG